MSKMVVKELLVNLTGEIKLTASSIMTEEIVEMGLEIVKAKLGHDPSEAEYVEFMEKSVNSVLQNAVETALYGANEKYNVETNLKISLGECDL